MNEDSLLRLLIEPLLLSLHFLFFNGIIYINKICKIMLLS